VLVIPRFRLRRAALVPRGKGHCEEQFVFNELPRCHVPGSNDAIRSLRLDRVAIDFLLRGCKYKCAVDAHGKLQLAQTTLTRQLERSVDLQAQRRASLFIAHS
jgi:hypothetical protein